MLITLTFNPVKAHDVVFDRQLQNWFGLGLEFLIN